jgi:hypothetical protein
MSQFTLLRISRLILLADDILHCRVLHGMPLMGIFENQVRHPEYPSPDPYHHLHVVRSILEVGTFSHNWSEKSFLNVGIIIEIFEFIKLPLH